MLEVDTNVMCTILFNHNFLTCKGRIRLKCKVAGSVPLFNGVAMLLYFPCCPTGFVCVHELSLSGLLR